MQLCVLLKRAPPPPSSLVPLSWKEASSTALWEEARNTFRWVGLGVELGWGLGPQTHDHLASVSASKALGLQVITNMPSRF